MTLVEQFAARRCATAPSVTQTRTLDTLPQTQQALIVGFDANDAITRRLFDLGFAPGVSVTRLRRAPLGDPLMFRVDGIEIVLRRAEARRVLVTA